MYVATPTQALWKNALRPHRRLSLGCDLSGDPTKLWSNDSSPSINRSSSTGTPSPPTFPFSPSANYSSMPSSVKTKAKLLPPVQRRRTTNKSTPHDLTHDDVQAHSQRHGECLAHPSGWGCDCEKVQLPAMDSTAAWLVMAMRFKVAHSPAICTSPSAGAKIPFDRRQSAPLPHLANAPHVEEHPVEKVFPRHPTRSTGPVVLAVPSRVATKLKLQAEHHASRVASRRLKPLLQHDILMGAAPRHGGARDVLPTSRTNPSTKPTGGMRINSSRRNSVG